MKEIISHKVMVAFSNHPSGIASESFWADFVGDELYEIRNIPFYSYGINYQDLVSVEDKDGILVVKEVVKRSGHHTVRVVFKDGKSAKSNYSRLIEFKGEGIGSEKLNDDFYALNVTPQRDYEEFIGILDELENKNILDYEVPGEWKGGFDGD